MIQVYHNPRCSKSRCALTHLESKGISYQVVDYLNEEITVDQLSGVISLLKIKPFDLIRQGEDVYKTRYKGKQLTDEEWIEVMVNNPKLIERPIVIHNDRAVVARPTELIDTIL